MKKTAKRIRMTRVRASHNRPRPSARIEWHPTEVRFYVPQDAAEPSSVLAHGPEGSDAATRNAVAVQRLRDCFNVTEKTFDAQGLEVRP